MTRNTLYSYDNTAFTAWIHEHELQLRVTRGAPGFVALLSGNSTGRGLSVDAAIADLANSIAGKSIEIEGDESLMVPQFTKTIKED